MHSISYMQVEGMLFIKLTLHVLYTGPIVFPLVCHLFKFCNKINHLKLDCEFQDWVTWVFTISRKKIQSFIVNNLIVMCNGLTGVKMYDALNIVVVMKSC